MTDESVTGLRQLTPTHQTSASIYGSKAYARNCVHEREQKPLAKRRYVAGFTEIEAHNKLKSKQRSTTRTVCFLDKYVRTTADNHNLNKPQTDRGGRQKSLIAGILITAEHRSIVDFIALFAQLKGQVAISRLLYM